LIDEVSVGHATVLHFAAQEGHEAVVAQLLNHHPSLIDLKDVANSTALHFAAHGGHFKVVVELLARCPSSSDEDRMGQTPLFCAASKRPPRGGGSIVSFEP